MNAIAALTLAGIEFAATANAEVSAGRLPNNPGRPSELSFVTTVVPAMGVRYAGDRHRETLVYSTRLFWRTSQQRTFRRPLVFHTISADESVTIAPRLTFSAGASGSYGETDYSAFNLVLGEGQTTTVAEPIIRTTSATGEAGLRHQLSRRTSISYELTGGFLRRIDTATDSTSAIPTRRNLQGRIVGGRTVSRRDSLSFPLSASYYDFSSGERFISVTSEPGWSRKLSLRTTLTVSAGATYARQLASKRQLASEEDEGGRNQWLPSSSVALSSVLRDKSGHRLAINGSFGVQSFYDPVIAILEPRASASLSLGYSTGKWKIAPRGSFVTSVSPDPRDERLGEERLSASTRLNALGEDETLMSLNVPVSYSINPYLGLSFGVRLGGRGPHLSESFELRRKEYRGFVALRGTWGTSPGGSQWVY